ncbi:MAG: glycerol-3-phosphate 1-O-acyltransferase PlsY [Sphingobacteriaceae bacterium]|nr:glycerol-3-phosphate 1-O-acyltransferase PlsY [Sphingobacteriaceae bacterium]
MEILYITLFLFVAYLLGSIPTSVWIGKFFYNIDVREFGSGNAGATNTFRVLGKKAGIPVLIIDILKGTAAVSLSFLSGFQMETPFFTNFQIGLGIAALIGHIFPVFAGFRGGKGVATILGVVICITPISCCVALLVFLTVLLITRYVSLGSIMAGISYPIILNLGMHNTDIILVVFSILTAVLLVITHRKNIVRLVNKQEARIKLYNKAAN